MSEQSQKMFDKLARKQYGDESFEQSKRMQDYWDEFEDEELEDLESQYEYIIEHD